MLLEHLYETYSADSSQENAATPEAPSATTSMFLDAIRNLPTAQQRAIVTELEAFFNGTYPCADGDALGWWKVNLLLSVSHHHIQP